MRREPDRCQDPPRFGAGPADPAARTPPTGGRTFHVGADGSDSADCSAAAPCRQIAHAVGLLGAGDTLVIGDGEYARFTLSGAKGREDAPIALFASGAGALVRGDPDCDRRNHRCANAILIERSQYVVVDGLGATGASRAGLAVELGRRITVRNGVFADNGTWGIFSSFVDDLVIEHNRTSASRSQHGIYASNSGDRTIIRHNLVHDNKQGGIQINADWNFNEPQPDYPGQVDGITTGAVVEGNVIYDNGRGGGAAINLDGVQDSVVRNNLLFANHASGIALFGDQDGLPDTSDSQDGDGRQGPRGMVIVHNTVVQPHGARAALLFRYSAGPNLVRDNILLCADEHRAGILLGGEEDVKYVDSDYNVLDRVLLDGNQEDGKLVALASWRRQGHDIQSLSAGQSQLFVAPGCDFNLAPASPARDRGAVVAEAGGVDLLGHARALGSAPDLGALEAAPAR